MHTAGCKYMPDPENCLYLGRFKSRAAALSKAQEHYPRSSGCVYCTLSGRFCQAALDGLKSFRNRELTARFLRKHDLPVRRLLRQMWDDVEAWMNGIRSRCVDLLEYVDDLKMWGRQYVFLFEIEDECVEQLSPPDYVQNLEGGKYEQPIYIWNATEPLLVQVKRELDRVIFKLVGLRKFDLVVEGVRTPFEERSTNFFIVDLADRCAELRIQELPIGARRNLRQERDLLLKEIRRCLDTDKLHPIRLEPVMTTMIRRPICPVTSARFKATEGDGSPGTPPLIAIRNYLFRRPIPSEVNAHWDCSQDVLGKRPLHFRLNGGSDYVAFDGIADPARVSDVLKKIVAISRGRAARPLPPGEKPRLVGGPPFEPEKPLPRRGFVGRPLAELEGKPVAQAVLLSAGAVAAAIIWIGIEQSGNYLFETAVEKALHVPMVAITVFAEIVWISWYYGLSRIAASFRALFRLGWRDIAREIAAARRRGKAYAELARTDDATEQGASGGHARTQIGVR